MPSDADDATLGKSAGATLSKRGGSLDATLDALCHWRPATALELTRFVLEAAGFAVESTTDSIKAILLISILRPDLTLINIQMPALDGLESTRQVMADHSLRYIVVVAFTAFARTVQSHAHRAKGRQMQANRP